MDDDFNRYARLRSRKGPCPACNLHINVGESSCVHCDYQLTKDEMEMIYRYANNQKIKGVRKGLLVFPIILFFVYFIFAIIQYSEI